MDRKGKKVGSLEGVFVEMLSGRWAFLECGDLVVRIWEVRLTDGFGKHLSPPGTDLLTQNLSGTGKPLWTRSGPLLVQLLVE